MSNGNTNTDKVSKFIKEVGFPIAICCGLFFVGITYWIAPQTKTEESQRVQVQTLVDAMAHNQIELTRTYGILSDAVQAMRENHATLVNAVEQNGMKIDQTNEMMATASDLMKDVPEQRRKELVTLEAIKENIIGQEMVDKLDTFTKGTESHHENANAKLDVILDQTKPKPY